MAFYSQENKTRADWGQLESHSHDTQSKQEQAQPSFDFQIAPESGIFLATEHTYLTEFRHINCAEYSSAGMPPPCSGSAWVDIRSQSEGLDGSCQWMQVCPGGCNEESENRNDIFEASDSMAKPLISNETIAAILYKRTRALCKIMHPYRVQVLEIVDTRVVWSSNSPIPAYFSPSKKTIVAHSSAVTPGHLALVQVRGHIDNIQLDFQTYDPSIE